jgi:hypothetical protein
VLRETSMRTPRSSTCCPPPCVRWGATQTEQRQYLMHSRGDSRDLTDTRTRWQVGTPAAAPCKRLALNDRYVCAHLDARAYAHSQLFRVSRGTPSRSTSVCGRRARLGRRADLSLRPVNSDKCVVAGARIISRIRMCIDALRIRCVSPSYMLSWNAMIDFRTHGEVMVSGCTAAKCTVIRAFIRARPLPRTP